MFGRYWFTLVCADPHSARTEPAQCVQNLPLSPVCAWDHLGASDAALGCHSVRAEVTGKKLHACTRLQRSDQ
jgi:hypothetical protein